MQSVYMLAEVWSKSWRLKVLPFTPQWKTAANGNQVVSPENLFAQDYFARAESRFARNKSFSNTPDIYIHSEEKIVRQANMYFSFFSSIYQANQLPVRAKRFRAK